MKKFLVLLSFIFVFTACDKDLGLFEKTYRDSSLWVNIDKHIENLSITYTAKNHKGKLNPCVVVYDNGKITPLLDVDLRADKVWTEVYEGQAESSDLSISYNNKEYKIKGFKFGETRFIEIILTYNGEIKVITYDLETIDKIVNI